MDRLIKRKDEFVYLAIAEKLPKEKQEIEGSKEVLEGLYATWQKLADYEDTELMPKEIIDLQEQNKYLLEKLEKYEWKYGSVDTAMFYAELQGKC